MGMKGIIRKIKIYPARGEAGREVSEGRLMENLGLLGDYHARTPGPNGGKISLMYEGLGEAGTLCASRFKENITIWCQSPFLSPGTRFSAGEAVLEMSGETKHCHKECELFRAGKPCSLAGLSLFARVLKGGIIRPGDELVPGMSDASLP